MKSYRYLLRFSRRDRALGPSLSDNITKIDDMGGKSQFEIWALYTHS